MHGFLEIHFMSPFGRGALAPRPKGLGPVVVETLAPSACRFGSMTLLGLSGDNDQAIVGYAVGSSYRIFIVGVGI